MSKVKPAGLQEASERSATRGARKWGLLGGFLVLAGGISAAVIPNLFPFRDPTGVVSTYNVNGPIDENASNNPFFESLGTNGRTCGTCHIAANAMGLSAASVQQTFAESHGRDPLFAAVDGANCPNGAPGNPADHSLLLNHGLIRVFITLPATAQFSIKPVHDPYGCASVVNSQGQTISVYRRPLPTTNLTFLSTIMFDGRETITPLNSEATFMQNLTTDLLHQSMDATLVHAQAANPPTAAQQAAIVNFELGLFSAQIADDRAGVLTHDGAQGGAVNLAAQAPDYYPGKNDVLGADPHGVAFNPVAFTIFDSWTNATSRGLFGESRAEARRRIAAGQALFNTRQLTISSVRGLNDNKALGSIPVAPFTGTCTTCHDTPNVGDHSLPLPLDIGTGHSLAHETDPVIANAVSQLDFPDVPVYEITGCPNPFAPAGSSAEPFVIYTTDPGKGLVTGQCSDVNRVKGPVLRGLAARAPYFHNGAAHDLNELVNFYNQRFQMNLTDEEKADLIAFLNSL